MEMGPLNCAKVDHDWQTGVGTETPEFQICQNRGISATFLLVKGSRIN